MPELSEWVLRTAAQYCSQCPDPCCKRTIMMGVRETEPFRERGIPVLGLEEISWQVRAELTRFGSDSTHYRLDGQPIPKPALIEFVAGELYVNYGTCPFFSKDGCAIHDDPRRPQICVTYPLTIQRGVVCLSESCQPFNSLDVLSDLHQQFPQVRIRLS